MYHSIISADSDRPEVRETGAELYDVRLEDFRFQLHKIRECLGGIYSADFKERFERPAVVLTFDDGEMNNYQNVFPLLKEFNLPAYFFVTASRIGAPGYMGPTEMQIMSNAGMTIGSHGLTHQILTGLDDDALEKEMAESRRIIERVIGKTVASFSVPRGFYDERVIAAAKAAGYAEIFVSGLNPPPVGIMGRLAVKGDWSIGRFEMALRGERPLDEKIFELVSKAAKKVLGGRGYDAVRSAILSRKKS